MTKDDDDEKKRIEERNMKIFMAVIATLVLLIVGYASYKYMYETPEVVVPSTQYRFKYYE